MLILKQANSDKVQLITSSVATLDVVASFVDQTNASPPAGEPAGNQGTAISSATTTDIVATPGSSKIRNVKSILVTNKDASTPCTVTFVANLNSTQYKMPSFLLQAGDAVEWIVGIGFYKIPSDVNAGEIIKVLTSDDTGGAANNSAQPWFPTAGGVTLPGATSYLMEGLLRITSGATSHTLGMSFGGTATLSSIDYFVGPAHRSAADTLTATYAGIPVTSASNAVVDAGGTSVGHYALMRGWLRTNAGGTFIPQFQFSANPTGTITIKRGTYFRLRAYGDNTFTSQGTWA